MDLFTHGRQAQIQREAPLAHRMRPQTLDEYIGQEHIIAPGRLLRRAIQADQLSSLIFYGPPGTGKTTLAMVIANSTQSHFITINAVLAGVKEIREAIETALERRNLYGQRTTLFVDEVHRWNKAQQDALLPHVENGTIILIGATTENPYFEVNKALVSRSRIFQLRPLTPENLRQIALQTLRTPERGYAHLAIDLDEDALDHLVDVANGDARSVLNALELAVETTEEVNGRRHITLPVAEESIQRRAVLYDKDGDAHYDTISAFIKSVRGSDPDAALYWAARMVYAGEDPRFIFRRMAILAGEDVGMADPQAMTVVLTAWETFERIGMPEGRFPLAQAILYLATCPKSNSAFAFFDALASVEKEQEADVPNPLKDGNRDKEGFGHGEGYLYPHAYRDHWVAQQYLPAALQGKLFYQPSDQGYEQRIAEEVARRREAQLSAMVEAPAPTPLEIWTTSPANKAKEAWLQRAVAQNGRFLSHQRDKLFGLAEIQRHHLVLDLNASTGLLTWEAVRRAPEGGVWALAHQAADGEALRQQASRLLEVERPQVLIGSPAELPALLAWREEADLRFDRVLGRNLLTATLGISPGEMWAILRGCLAANGRLCLVQTLPRHTQRLYQLIEWPASAAALQAKVARAEEAIYHDPSDPLVNWDEEDLLAGLTAVGLTPLAVLPETEKEERLITPEQMGRWFGEATGEKGRLSYGQRLQAGGVTAVELKKVQQLYSQQLTNQTIVWQTHLLYLTATM